MATREIRRYSNRKLYDTTDRHYVRLDDVAALIRRGEDVLVRDHVTQADLTAQTLAQCIFEEERKAPRVRAEVFRVILKLGGSLNVSSLGEIVQGGLSTSSEAK
jgi:polyhydroxyalkanoate synthesis repressor PhaR